MRTQDEIFKQLSETGFVSHPQDVITILHSSGVIADTITINIYNHNDGTDVTVAIKNFIKSWNFLKTVSEVYMRFVLYKTDDNLPIFYEDSMPYKHRFTDTRF